MCVCVCVCVCVEATSRRESVGSRGRQTKSVRAGLEDRRQGFMREKKKGEKKSVRFGLEGRRQGFMVEGL